MGFRLFKGKDLKSQNVLSVNELKDITEKQKDRDFHDKVRDVVRLELKSAGILEQIEELSGNLAEINKKIREMNESLLPLNRMKEDSLRKMKMKRLVIQHLRGKKRLSASELASLMNLSRTRCSEYLIEMERAGLAKGTIISKQKFYEYKGD